MFNPDLQINDVDPALWNAMMAELQRQEDHVELIASENYASPQVMRVVGSVLTNKYAEGYPTKRYYGGCEYVDVAEQLAIDRAKALFGAEYANVQPHSGSQANAAVYMAMLQPGDTLLGMSLAHGGHLTHGASVNFSGKIYKSVAYGLEPETETLDYAQVAELAAQHKPKMIVAGASAYSRVIDWNRLRDVIAAKALAFKEAMAPEFKTYQQRVKANARAMADTLAARGLRIVSGGTDSHVFLLDLRARKITGKAAEAVLGRAHLTVNKNAIPNDPEKPFVTSGIRIGAPAMTTRGFGADEARRVANLMADVLEAPADDAVIARVAADVTALCRAFPVYGPRYRA